MRQEALIPKVGVVTDIRQDTPDVKTFRVVGLDGNKLFEHMPGQCAMVSIPGIGEGMFSITSSPTNKEFMEFSIKKCGCLTSWLHMMEVGQEVTVRGPLHWAETELKPKAELAARGEGEFSAGERCRFCKVKATCRKQAEYNLQLAKYDFAMPDKLTDTEIEAILETADQLVAWASDVKEYALQQSLQGKAWKNWKLVEGRARRAYCSETAAAEAVQAAGFDPYEHKVLGITAMTRMLGKKKFEELLGDLLVKPKGKPTLVPLSDKRPAWNTAQVDFKE